MILPLLSCLSRRSNSRRGTARWWKKCPSGGGGGRPSRGLGWAFGQRGWLSKRLGHRGPKRGCITWINGAGGCFWEWLGGTCRGKWRDWGATSIARRSRWIRSCWVSSLWSKWSQPWLHEQGVQQHEWMVRICIRIVARGLAPWQLFNHGRVND